jgi:integrase
MNRLWNIARWVENDFDQMTEENVKELVRRITQMNYTERTKVDHYCVIKKFFKWLDSDDRRVRWLRISMKRKDRKLPEELLKKEDVQELIKACVGVRDKAIVSVLWESGVRVGEFLGMEIKNVQFDGYGAVIIVGNRGENWSEEDKARLLGPPPLQLAGTSSLQGGSGSSPLGWGGKQELRQAADVPLDKGDAEEGGEKGRDKKEGESAHL